MNKSSLNHILIQKNHIQINNGILEENRRKKQKLSSNVDSQNQTQMLSQDLRSIISESSEHGRLKTIMENATNYNHISIKDDFYGQHYNDKTETILRYKEEQLRIQSQSSYQQVKQVDVNSNSNVQSHSATFQTLRP